MLKRHKRALYTVLGAFVLSCVSSTLRSNDKRTEIAINDTPSCIGSCHSAAPVEATTPSRRQAVRLHERLVRNGVKPPSVAVLTKALEDRSQLLKKELIVTVKDEHNPSFFHTWKMSLGSHPGLLHLKTTWNAAHFDVDADAVAQMLHTNGFDGSKTAVHPTITSLKTDGKLKRGDNPEIALAGFSYDENDAEAIADALADTNQNHISLSAPYSDASISYTVQGKELELSLLASGVSNFENSPDNREINVLKALEDHVNNIVVDPGETFSFNDTLGGPVTLSRGWVEALGLFGGGTAMTPGGGICQAATTVYRAALIAGFPILRRKSHSVYVPYYEKYGAGIDATIFPGVQDLVFTNDTDGPIVIQAYNDEYDAYVNVYGISDNRTVAIEGPYFAGTRPRPKELRPLGNDEIGWVRHVTRADGSKITTPFISTYTHPIARTVTRSYPVETISEFVVEADNSLTMHAMPSL